jgi:hypothetical protein
MATKVICQFVVVLELGAFMDLQTPMNRPSRGGRGDDTQPPRTREAEKMFADGFRRSREYTRLFAPDRLKGRVITLASPRRWADRADQVLR